MTTTNLPQCCLDLIRSYIEIDESYPRDRARLFCPVCKASLAYSEEKWQRDAPPPEVPTGEMARRVAKRATLKPQPIVHQYGLLDGLKIGGEKP